MRINLSGTDEIVEFAKKHYGCPEKVMRDALARIEKKVIQQLQNGEIKHLIILIVALGIYQTWE